MFTLTAPCNNVISHANCIIQVTDWMIHWLKMLKDLQNRKKPSFTHLAVICLVLCCLSQVNFPLEIIHALFTRCKKNLIPMRGKANKTHQNCPWLSFHNHLLLVKVDPQFTEYDMKIFYLYSPFLLAADGRLCLAAPLGHLSPAPVCCVLLSLFKPL